MMTSFATKRKARKISVDDDEDLSTSGNSASAPTVPKHNKIASKQSSLRKSMSLTDNTHTSFGTSMNPAENDDVVPTVIKPSLSRSSSKRQKTKKTGSRLSFGPGTADGEDALLSKPKKSGLSHKAFMNSTRNLPMRSPFRAGDDEDRPKYNKEYLQELESSTPNTPARAITADDGGDPIELDDSELEGAMIVEDPSVSTLQTTSMDQPTDTRILTQAEIDERKSRRHNLALEAEEGECISFEPRINSTKKDTRLVREDEDLGEGFDDFVEDGGIALGRKAEREARRRTRKEMAEMIQEAEDDSESDSEAERIAAFDNAQAKAGMEGLKQQKTKEAAALAHYAAAQVPAKISVLPDLMECVEAFRVKVRLCGEDIENRKQRIAALKLQIEGYQEQEKLIQRKLDEAGEKYGELLGLGSARVGEVDGNGNSPMPVLSAVADLHVERGLESFGNTLLRKEERDEDGDEIMGED